MTKPTNPTKNMSETAENSDFEFEIGRTLQSLSERAPGGPSESSVLAALNSRSRRRQNAALGIAAMFVVAAGSIWLLQTGSDSESNSVELPPKSARVDRSADHDSNQTSLVAIVADRPSGADRDIESLLGHMKSIPIERGVVLHVPGMDHLTTDVAATATPSVPTWKSGFDIDQVDFALLPSQGECIFCVAVPSLEVRRPF